jgi:hypothetical protein
MIVYETAEKNKLPPKQLSILTSTILRDYMKSKGQFNFVALDPDAIFADQPGNKLWKDAMARPRVSLPWAIIFSAKGGVPYYEGPLFVDVDATLAKIKKGVGE